MTLIIVLYVQNKHVYSLFPKSNEKYFQDLELNSKLFVQ